MCDSYFRLCSAQRIGIPSSAREFDHTHQSLPFLRAARCRIAPALSPPPWHCAMSSIDTTDLIKNFKGDIVTPNRPDYGQAISRWAANAARKAKVVAFVKDNEDVTRALKFAQENRLPIAVRSGGHNAAGASSIQDGLVIDLSRHMNGVTVDPSKRLAYVGGGALWETVDKEGIKHGLATVAGTVNHTGVGGLTLGGGYGWLSASHGLALDNVVQAIVVTADGSILTVNEAENPDLYFAIRGGGGNFGVVTEFVLQLHPQRATVYAGSIIYPASAVEKLVAATEAWWKTVRDKESMLQIATVGPDGHPIFVVFPFYNGTEAEGRESFKRLLEAGPIADMSKVIPYEELNGLQNAMVNHGSGVYMKGVALKHLYLPAITKVHERVAEIMSGSVFRVVIIYEFFGLGKINAVSTTATAFRREKANNVLVSLFWDASEDRNGEARDLAHELCTLVTEGQTGMTTSEGLGYSNYDPDGTETRGTAAVVDKAKFVFGENYLRLQAIKRRYDPNNIFNKWFPIVPA
ncbi:unnamed protein product [Cyclocybe aegerita]|uniref:FAD-binding PCMH-type domain-containing protein n=1 Tax=Cyclocybe aegerita TaxID=1973307 RepID=A0A8S0VX74_CYCAE|nr:unnamed protein product [Cyclocybe aegerita]